MRLLHTLHLHPPLPSYIFTASSRSPPGRYKEANERANNGRERKDLYSDNWQGAQPWRHFRTAPSPTTFENKRKKISIQQSRDSVQLHLRPPLRPHLRGEEGSTHLMVRSIRNGFGVTDPPATTAIDRYTGSGFNVLTALALIAVGTRASPGRGGGGQVTPTPTDFRDSTG